MGKEIKYPVGVQTFSEIIRNNYFYIDKTALVHQLVTKAKYVFLSRPRRFGKTLLMSTLEAYFKGQKELFERLAISKLETKWETYPVFRFDLSPTNYDSPKKLISLVTRCLDFIEEQYGLSSNREVISDRFIDLIHQAHKRYEKKVVILIDEYDKPMLDCLQDTKLHEKIKAELRGFYSGIKACDEYIKFAMLTGITKFGKVSIFSGLNNLKDISMLPRYNAICGITETEFRRDFPTSVREFAEVNDMTEEETWETFKITYDGYRFAPRGENIYNPYSVLSAFDDEIIKSFWYSSGSSSYLVKLIETNSYPLDKIDDERRRENELDSITNLEYDFIPLLYQSGYLTIKDYDKESKEYTLGFPNTEVREAFWNSLAYHFFMGTNGRSAFNLQKCLRDVNEGRPDDFMRRMQSLFADTPAGPERNKEVHFQNMMAIVCKMMGLTVRTEVHSAAGRCDMQILTSSYVYIFEFKIDGSPQEAMDQIHDRGYALPFAADPRTIFLIAANFSTKTRTLTPDWLIETFKP